jgi:hypothetical protein
VSKSKILIATASILSLTAAASFAGGTNDKPTVLIQDCPEAWIDDRMASTVPPPKARSVPRQYFIYKGVRRELHEFDMDWVKRHYKITPEVVH